MTIKSGFCGGLLFCALVTLAACHKGGPAETVQRVDSAGVEIVKIPEAALPPLNWHVEKAPAMVIGADSDSGGYLLKGVINARRLKDGRLVVMDAGKPEGRMLPVFDSAGKYLTSMAREGRGPGEFEAPGALGLLTGDSIWVFDEMLRALSVFSPSGAFARRVSFSGPAGSCRAEGGFADGFLVANCIKVVGDAVHFEYFRVGLDGTVQELIAADTTTQPLSPPLWTAMTGFAVGPSQVYRSSISRYDIDVFGPTGKLTRRIRLGLEPRAPTQKEIDDYRVSAIGTHKTAAAEAEARKRVMSASVPKLLPTWMRVMVDNDGNLWAQEYQPVPTLPVNWFVFDPAGNPIGRIELPPRWTVNQIGSDYILVSPSRRKGHTAWSSTA
jgi:hypothetical protein